jgi:hypothetical protein
VSGLRPSPRIRAERLAREVRRRELEERRAGMSAPELAWERALELAPAEEIEELERLEALSLTQEPRTLPMLETLQSMRALKERMYSRSAPVWAAFYRTQRCLLLWALKQLEEEAIEAYEAWFRPRHPSGRRSEAGAAGSLADELGRLHRRRYGLSTARINREHAVRFGVEPATDVEEASRLVGEVLEAVDAGDTDRVLRLVGRI